MDLLKILSRGTKKTANQATTPAPTSKPTNPQLYHDPTRGLKRKRNEEALDVTLADEAQDVDFFAAHGTQDVKTSETAKKKATEGGVEQEQAQILDADEVRQILRSHRLKFTVLSKHEDKKSKVKKSKKKEQAKAKAKDGKQSLFPQPLTSFTDLRNTYKISPRLLENLAKQGFRLPTEVQLGSLPLLIDPRTALQDAVGNEVNLSEDGSINFLAVAPTGSGKTLSFLIPSINSILKRRAEEGRQDSHVLESLVIAPTRELAHQIVREGQKLAAGTGIKVVGFKKGMRLPTGDEMLDLDEESSDDADDDSESSEDDSDETDNTTTKGPVTKADILVTTPMLLLNFLSKGSKSRRTLPTVRSVVLDEGDVLLDELFRDQTLGIVSCCTHDSLRFTCWSATMGSNIESLLLEKFGSQESKSPAPLIRLVVGLKDTAVPSVNHHLIYTGDNERGKLYTLRQLLHPSSANSSGTVPDIGLPFLVFVQTVERASSLYEELKFEFPAEAGGFTRIAALHSSLSESARSKIIARFRANEIWVLITTDLLMRGIDFRGVNGVINFDIPTSAAAYIHRVGRTGRAGHEGGVAVTFYTKEDIPYLKNIANVISLSEKQAGKEDGIPKWLMDALPKVQKDDKKKLKQKGVESRRGNKAEITSKSAWEKRRENNRKGAIAGSKKRKLEGHGDESDDAKTSEWGGLDG
ncbi:putative ATP-dependent RNA helicase [Seiridium unicorne]|uniref:ATP-dependent RNA helicase ROK1 n=1 Tax=Seiridium unicorne TaxID=138068 RepID=A0ABR2UNV1_9PEZI